MIHKISFKNFKLFKNEQTIEFRPITILIGKNNSGKSSILKLITAIEGALKSKDPEPINLINDDVVLGNEYKDLIYGKFGRALEIKLFQKNDTNDKYTELSVEIAFDLNKNKPILEYWKLGNVLEFRNIRNNIYQNEIDGEEYNCNFGGIYLNNYSNKNKADLSNALPGQVFKLNADFIGSVRAKTEKYYDYKPNGNKSKKSKIDGSNLYEFLIGDWLSTEKKYFNKISEWIRQKFEDWDIYIDVDSEPFHIELRKEELKVNLTETGMGIGQSLPLIIRAIKPCTEETLIIIEEPECHLHPYAHAQLAQLFANSLKDDSNKKYLIETHSQNFVLRLRRLVAEGELNHKDLAIYYVDFDEEKNESNLREIKVDDGGGVDWWPSGIFGETSIETRAIYNAQINDLKNVD